MRPSGAKVNAAGKFRPETTAWAEMAGAEGRGPGCAEPAPATPTTRATGTMRARARSRIRMGKGTPFDSEVSIRATPYHRGPGPPADEPEPFVTTSYPSVDGPCTG